MTLTVTNTRGLGMWFQADVLRVLEAVHAAITAPLDILPTSPSVQAYRAGHEATLDAIARAFGLTYTSAGKELTP